MAGHAFLDEAQAIMMIIHRYTAPLGHGLLKSRLRSKESSRPDGSSKVPPTSKALARAAIS